MERLRVGVVGGGPAGAYAAWQAAALGHQVAFFDHRAPWEKPCGGGITVADGWRIEAQGESHRFDLLVGADGAVSRTRELLVPDFPGYRHSIASGFFIPAARTRIETKFFHGARGYLWFFPRNDHLSVGLCLWGGDASGAQGRETRARLLDLLAEYFPDLDPGAGTGYGAFIPTILDPSCWAVDRGGPDWALVGDAGGFVDAITGEGIFYALRSAQAWARALAAGAVETYDARWRSEFGAELTRASALVHRFYHPRFIERVVRYGARHQGIRSVLADLVMGTQSYQTLRHRLQRELLHSGWRRLTGWPGSRARLRGA